MEEKMSHQVGEFEVAKAKSAIEALARPTLTGDSAALDRQIAAIKRTLAG